MRKLRWRLSTALIGVALFACVLRYLLPVSSQEAVERATAYLLKVDPNFRPAEYTTTVAMQGYVVSWPFHKDYWLVSYHKDGLIYHFAQVDVVTGQPGPWEGVDGPPKITLPPD